MKKVINYIILSFLLYLQSCKINENNNLYRNTITAQCFKYYLLHKRITVLISNGHYSTPFVEEIISNCFNLLPIMTIVDRDAAITIIEANIILV